MFSHCKLTIEDALQFQTAYAGKQNAAIHTSLFTFTQFRKQHLGLLSTGHLLSWELSPRVLSFGPRWPEQTMEAIFANLSRLESGMFLSKCWVAFFLLYWTSLGLSAKPRASLCLGSFLPDLHGELEAALCGLGSCAPPGQEQSADQLGGAHLFPGNAALCLPASPAGSVGGWSCGEPRLTHVFFPMEAALRRRRSSSKNKKRRPEGEGPCGLSGSVSSLFRAPALS